MGSTMRRLAQPALPAEVENSKEVTPVRTRFVAPKSPHTLLQEELNSDPWKVLVCCIMLNCTTRKQMEPVMWEFFRKWPDAGIFLQAPNEEVSQLIKSLGFYNRRTQRLKKFSEEYLQLIGKDLLDEAQKSSLHFSPCLSLPLEGSSTWTTRMANNPPSGGEIRSLHGIGEYAGRAYEIFCLGEVGEAEPDDGPLTKYWKWACENRSFFVK